MQAIPYRIQQINTLQFAIFPDKFINGEEMSTQAEFHFGYTPQLESIRCIAAIEYVQGDTLLLSCKVQCVFEISPEGIEELKKNMEIPAGFLQYMATIAVGTTRGIIHSKTEGTLLNAFVLPPLDLTQTIDHNLKIEN